MCTDLQQEAYSQAKEDVRLLHEKYTAFGICFVSVIANTESGDISISGNMDVKGSHILTNRALNVLANNLDE